jgi:serine/threonine-protein kinase
MTQTANVLGTAQYLSPEQARGETVDARSDIYSTGCLLYELLTGRPPFQGESPVAVAYQHVRENPVPPTTLNPDVGPEADAIVMKALTKNPGNRYQSATEMRADIRRALDGATVSAPPVMAEPPTQAITTVIPDEPTSQDKRRRRGFIALLIGAIVALLLLGVAAWALLGGDANTVTVPDVVNTPIKEAQQQLDDAGLNYDVQTQNSDKKKNTVLSQDPAGGSEAQEGDTVTLVVSKGPQKITDAGLHYAGSNDVNSDQPAGTVVSSDPAEGKQVTEGSDVTIDVSNGEVEVPDVVGDSLNVATARLENAGFDVTPVNETTDQGDPGTVIAQDPAAGSTARLGTAIVITVAQAPATPSPSETPSPSPSDTKTNNGNGGGLGTG